MTSDRVEYTTILIKCKGLGRNPDNNRVAASGPELNVEPRTPMLEALPEAGNEGWRLDASYALALDGYVTFVLSRAEVA